MSDERITNLLQQHVINNTIFLENVFKEGLISAEELQKGKDELRQSLVSGEAEAGTRRLLESAKRFLPDS